MIPNFPPQPSRKVFSTHEWRNLGTQGDNKSNIYTVPSNTFALVNFQLDAAFGNTIRSHALDKYFLLNENDTFFVNYTVTEGGYLYEAFINNRSHSTILYPGSTYLPSTIVNFDITEFSLSQNKNSLYTIKIRDYMFLGENVATYNPEHSSSDGLTNVFTVPEETYALVHAIISNTLERNSSRTSRPLMESLTILLPGVYSQLWIDIGELGRKTCLVKDHTYVGGRDSDKKQEYLNANKVIISTVSSNLETITAQYKVKFIPNALANFLDVSTLQGRA